MKKIFALVLIAFVFLSPTCKKDMQISDQGLKKIFGKWEWVSTSGGFAGKITTPSKAGYSVKVEFNSEGIYQKYRNDSLVDRKQFSFSKDKSIHSSEQVWIISFTNDTIKFKESSLPMAVSFVGQDTLMLDEQVNDGFGYEYVRIK